MNKVRIFTNRIMKFIDICANMTDSMYQGVYGGNQKHPADLNEVLDRAKAGGVEKMIVCVGTVNEADEAIKIAKSNDSLYITMGCHPTRCGEFAKNPEEYYENLSGYINNNRDIVVAIGECGLDYDRLRFCDAATQRTYFEKQFDLVDRFGLPMLLHCRNSFDDFWQILERNRERIRASGVVHSFDGTVEEANRLVEFGLYIGINGCSLKTDENLKTVAQIPIDRILIETDAPWCGVRPSHAGSKYLKTKFPTIKKKEKWEKTSLIDGRNEPIQIVHVLEILAAIRNEKAEDLADQIYKNSLDLFFNKNNILR